MNESNDEKEKEKAKANVKGVGNKYYNSSTREVKDYSGIKTNYDGIYTTYNDIKKKKYRCDSNNITYDKNGRIESMTFNEKPN